MVSSLLVPVMLGFQAKAWLTSTGVELPGVARTSRPV
jgi:hypothetical protein